MVPSLGCSIRNDKRTVDCCKVNLEQPERETWKRKEVTGEPRPAALARLRLIVSNPSHSVVLAVVVNNGLKAPQTLKGDKRYNSACPPRIPSPYQVSSRYMQSCASQHLNHNPTHAYLMFSGP